MKSDRIKLYIIDISLVIFLLLAMMLEKIFTKQVIAVILLVFMILTKKIIKNKKSEFMHNNQITIFMSISVIIYIGIIYLLGIYFGYGNAIIKLNKWSMQNYIIPYIVIIISSEIIRKQILSKENKKSNVLVLIAMVLLEIVMTTSMSSLDKVSDYFTLIAFTVFSAIGNNLLYNYIVLNYRNIKSIIIYRLILTLYKYIIPIMPNIHILLESILRVILPYIIYLVIDKQYARKEKIVSTQTRKKEMIIGTISCVAMVIVLMVISCKFKYGALVIGSGSMTGTINKGDMIIYEKYKVKEEVNKGEIIIFQREDKKIVHRVIDKRIYGEEERYYTKGDANAQEDDGYVKQEEIVGKVKGRIQYIGYITLWLNDI